APLNAPWREIEGFLRQKARWILEKLDERAAAGTPVTLFGETGEWLPVFGRDVVLAVSAGRKCVRLAGDTLDVAVAQPHRRGAGRKPLVDWLKARVLEHFTPRAAHYAAQIGRAAPPVTISSARTLWGVCTSDGRIRLTWRLGLLAPELGDYVVAHEVA